MKLTWWCTAGFKVEFNNITILIDPFLSRNPAAEPKISLKPEEVTKADYIFLSHGHFDHSADVSVIAKQTGAKIFCSQKASEIFLREEVPENQIQKVSAGEELDFDSFKVTVIKSRHIKFGLTTLLWKFFSWKVLKSLRSLFSLLRNYPKGDVFGFFFQLKREALTFCHFGSGGFYKEELEKFQPDVFLAPVAGRRNAPQVLAVMTQCLNPKMVIGHHWDDFYPPISWRVPIEQFSEEVKKLLQHIVVKIPVPLEEMEIQSIT
ncbi:MAG TPA: MBL fold metallo-hydrolase [Candidatus Deferrimicrobium sp.]|nr:MBL fold metallo-hydrolase [Candidatus Deferrimicrobium sp.]